MQAKWFRRGRVYYRVAHVPSTDELVELGATSDVAFLAFRHEPSSVPSLRLMYPPAADATPRARRRWEDAQSSRIPASEFVELLDALGLRVLRDTHDFLHLGRDPATPNPAIWARQVTGRRPSRRRATR